MLTLNKLVMIKDSRETSSPPQENHIEIIKIDLLTTALDLPYLFLYWIGERIDLALELQNLN